MNNTPLLNHITSRKSIETMMQEFSCDKEIMVKEVTAFCIDNSASILMALAESGGQNPYGHFGLHVVYTENGISKNNKMVLKVKPHGDIMVNLINSLSLANGEKLSSVYSNYKSLTGFQYTHLKEHEIYKKLHPAIAPVIYGTTADVDRNVFAILMEYLEDVELLNSVMQAELWTDDHICAALKQLAEWHASTLNKNELVNTSSFMDTPNRAYMENLMPVLTALLNNAGNHFPELYTPVNIEAGSAIIKNIPDYWRHLEQLPKALIHNDCNPRNSCIKNTGKEKRLCLYDWELATFHIPQYDVAELLCFVLDEDRYYLRKSYVEYYRSVLHKLTGRYPNAAEFYDDFVLAANDFGMLRLNLYMMAHKVSPYPFIPRVVKSFFDTVHIQPIHKAGLW